MKTLSLAGLASLAALGSHAQSPAGPLSVFPSEPLVVTATRQLQPSASLRDAIVIPREEIEAAGALSLGELLERRAGIQVRANGGAGQPQGLFIRGAGSAQTLVLVDGLRVSSATVGTTSIENLPLELIERIEVVKGPLSSLYGSDAIGGVVQVFTRGKSTPHLFAATAFGTDNDRRVSAGLATSDERTQFSLAAGARKVDSPSATNARSFCPGVDRDRDPHENVFVNLHAGHRMWQDELVTVDAFASHGKTSFDACSPDDRNDQTLAGARLVSANNFAAWWLSRFAIGHGHDKIVTRGSFPNRFETYQDQLSWVNELKVPAGTLLAGAEVVRQRLRNDETRGLFAKRDRETRSGFVGLNESWAGQRLEASFRHDDDESFGKRNTGSASYGFEWPRLMRISATVAKGFRAPTFFDLYGPTSSFYKPNPALQPERSDSREASLRAPAAAAWQWRVTAFDNRIEELIVYVPAETTVRNVSRARIRGVEASIEGAWLGTRLRATLTSHRPRDEDTGARLPLRAERLASLDASRAFGRWTVGAGILAVGDRHEPTFDPVTFAPTTYVHRSYAVVDARVRYRFEKFWSVELAATNLGDKRYESAVGYDAPRRSILLSVRFDAF